MFIEFRMILYLRNYKILIICFLIKDEGIEFNGDCTNKFHSFYHLSDNLLCSSKLKMKSLFISDGPTILNILDAIDTPTSIQHDLSEKMAISAIQKSLMQCETVMKSPSSPTISLPGTPPAYTSTAVSQQGNFPPPPVYQQPRPRLNIQQAVGQLGGVRPAGAMPYTNSQLNTQVCNGTSFIHIKIIQKDVFN